jgi:hypothetical protein
MRCLEERGQVSWTTTRTNRGEKGRIGIQVDFETEELQHTNKELLNSAESWGHDLGSGEHENDIRSM